MSHVAAASFRSQDRDLRFARIHVAVLNCTSCGELGVEWGRMGVPTIANTLWIPANRPPRTGIRYTGGCRDSSIVAGIAGEVGQPVDVIGELGALICA